MNLTKSQFLKNDRLVIKIIYDNRKEDEAMQAGWGFSCLVERGDRKFLFDTGADAKAFFANICRLNISLEEISDVLFSHKHKDHVAGLEEVLCSMKRPLRLFLPKGFSLKFSSPILQTTHVFDFLQIDTGVYSVVMKGGFCLYEQALILRSSKGLILITGCAHPEIVSLIKNVKKRLKEPIHLILGGFHLFRKSTRSIDKIVDQIKSLQVEKVAPCHCTGDKAIAAFEKMYRDDFYKIGAGACISSEV